MFSSFINEIAAPLVRRLGTMVGTFLVSKGVLTDDASVIVNGVMAALLVVVDLGNSAAERRLRK